MELVLTNKVYRSILDECLSFPEVETGGILIGKKISEQCIVAPFSLGSGVRTLRTRSRYSPDVDWQQIYLEKLFSRYGVNYVGSYHRHPGAHCAPSTQDFKAACQIVTDPAWNVAEAIFPIINLTGKNISFHPYYFTRRFREFRLIGWRMVSSKDKLIKNVLKRGSYETKNHCTARVDLEN
ncbi:MAG: Mov34/MPN/PAD-1 family protein [Candidatus Paceibacterota bacterium]|jgi:integrative and conjugative element protein (TIGR02256 family)